MRRPYVWVALVVSVLLAAGALASARALGSRSEADAEAVIERLSKDPRLHAAVVARLLAEHRDALRGPAGAAGLDGKDGKTGECACAAAPPQPSTYEHCYWIDLKFWSRCPNSNAYQREIQFEDGIATQIECCEKRYR